LLNHAKPHEFHDRYIDLILNHALRPFYTSPDYLATEKDVNILRKTATILCFSEGKYPVIGNSILQALGLDSNPEIKNISESILLKYFKKFNNYSLNDSDRIDDGFTDLICELILWIDVNQIKINLLQERLT
jgi:hypothetical protein